MSLANGRQGEKSIATERAPAANVENIWGWGGDRCITFGLKNDGKVVELGARSRQGCAANLADQTEIKGNQPGLIRGLHLMQGLTGKGAGPADRLTTDGHFPREQD